MLACRIGSPSGAVACAYPQSVGTRKYLVGFLVEPGNREAGVELLRYQMRRRADPGRCVAQAARLAPGQRNQLLDRADRHRRENNIFAGLIGDLVVLRRQSMQENAMDFLITYRGLKPSALSGSGRQGRLRCFVRRGRPLEGKAGASHTVRDSGPLERLDSCKDQTRSEGRWTFDDQRSPERSRLRKKARLIERKMD